MKCPDCGERVGSQPDNCITCDEYEKQCEERARRDDEAAHIMLLTARLRGTLAALFGNRFTDELEGDDHD
jgi:hypothetical protein